MYLFFFPILRKPKNKSLKIWDKLMEIVVILFHKIINEITIKINLAINHINVTYYIKYWFFL